MPKGKPSDTDIERVKFALAGGYWIKGRDISKRYGIPYRNIRAVAEKTGDVISGQNGYRLASHATTAAESTERSQISAAGQAVLPIAHSSLTNLERHLTGDGFGGARSSENRNKKPKKRPKPRSKPVGKRSTTRGSRANYSSRTRN